MLPKVIIGSVVLALIVGVAWYVSYGLVIFPKSISTNPTPTSKTNTPANNNTTTTNKAPTINTTNTSTANTPTYPKAVQSVIIYAAFQFSISENQITVLSTSDKKDWPDICLGMIIPSYDCKKTKTSGYEVAIDADGRKVTYRVSEDSSIIRVVKN